MLNGFTWSTFSVFLLIIGLDMTSSYCEASPQEFWSTWSDGMAEVNRYTLSQPRYGEMRSGTLHLIYVTEPFSKSRHVKVDQYNPSDPDHVIALKLNIVETWQTGVYPYRLMTSHFVDAQADFAPLKVVFSSQEWCGTTYEETLWEGDQQSHVVRSYFDGESKQLETSAVVRPIDHLLIMGRGLQIGGPNQVKKLPEKWVESAKHRRLFHRPFEERLMQVQPRLTQKLETGIGKFTARSFSYTHPSGHPCELFIEVNSPYRVLAWKCADGEEAVLQQSERMPYWKLTGNADAKQINP